jgi:hypothetical protein
MNIPDLDTSLFLKHPGTGFLTNSVKKKKSAYFSFKNQYENCFLISGISQ